MQSYLRPVVCVALVLAATPVNATSIMVTSMWGSSIEAAQQTASQQGRLVLLHFSSDNCAPCRQLEATVFPWPEFQRAVTTNYVPVMINVDKQPQIAKKYGVKSWPSDVVITPGGEVLSGPAGCEPDKNRYIATLDNVAAQYRVRGTTRGGQSIAAAPNGFGAREVAYNQPANTQPAPDNNQFRPANNDAYAPQRGLPPPVSTPIGAQTPNWKPETAPYGYNNSGPPSNAPWQNQQADPRMANRTDTPSAPVNLGSAFQPQQGAYDPRGYSGRQDAAANDRNSSFPSKTATEGRAYIEGSTVNPGYAMPPLEVGRPTGNNAPADNNSFAQRDPRLNDRPAGMGPQQPGVTQPRNDAARGPMQTNPHLAQETPRANALGGAAPADRSTYGQPRPQGQGQMVQPATVPAGSPPVALDGYCPVALMKTGKWMAGNAKFGAIHRGRTYLFTSAQEQQEFLANPDKYSPMLSGYDPVKYVEQGQLVEGKRAHGVVQDDQMYLFVDEASLQRFWQKPNNYMTPVRQAMQQSLTPIAPNVRR